MTWGYVNHTGCLFWEKRFRSEGQKGGCPMPELLRILIALPRPLAVLLSQKDGQWVTLTRWDGVQIPMALTFYRFLQLCKEPLSGLGPGTFQIWIDVRTPTHCSWLDAETGALG